MVLKMFLFLILYSSLQAVEAAWTCNKPFEDGHFFFPLRDTACGVGILTDSRKKHSPQSGPYTIQKCVQEMKTFYLNLEYKKEEQDIFIATLEGSSKSCHYTRKIPRKNFVKNGGNSNHYTCRFDKIDTSIYPDYNASYADSYELQRAVSVLSPSESSATTISSYNDHYIQDSIYFHDLAVYYEDHPIAFFTKVVDFMVITSIKFEMQGSTTINAFLNYRYDSDRKMTLYRENDTMKIFECSVAECMFNITKPFTAQQVRINVLSTSFVSLDVITFRTFVYGVRAIPFGKKDDVILSTVFAPQHIDSEINLPEPTTITGFSSDNIIPFDLACIKYKYNGVLYDYKDMWSGEPTIFESLSNSVDLKPFVAESIIFSCIEWRYSPEPFLLRIFGHLASTASHKWLTQEKTLKNGKGVHNVFDRRGCEPIYDRGLISQTHSFHEDCITRPHLCQSGFSIQIVLTDPKMSSFAIKAGVAHEDNGFLIGTGFVMNFTKSNVEVFLQTDTKVYTINELRSTHKSFILTWSIKSGILLSGGGKKIGSDDSRKEGGNAFTGQMQAIYDMLRLDYEYESADQRPFMVKLWRKQLEAVEIEALENFKEKINPTKEDGFVQINTTLFGPHCNCPIDTCPCESEDLGPSISMNFTNSIRIKKWLDYDSLVSTSTSSPTIVDVLIYTAFPDKINAVFDINLPFNEIVISSAFLLISTDDYVNVTDCLKINFTQSLYAKEWCPSAETGDQVVDIHRELSRTIQLKYLQKSLSKTFKVSIHGLKLNSSEPLFPMKVMLNYQRYTGDSFYLISSMDSSSKSVDMTLATNSCVTLKVKFFGDGFSFVTFGVIEGNDDLFEVLRLYPKQINQTWETVSIPIGTLNQLTVKGYRNGKNGYIALKDLVYKDKCEPNLPSVSTCVTPREISYACFGHNMTVTAHSVKEELKDLGMPLPVFFLNDTQLITQVDNITFNDADVEFEKYRSNLNGNTIIIFKGKRKPFLPISINRMMATTFTIVSWVMTDHEEFKFFQIWSGDSAVFELNTKRIMGVSGYFNNVPSNEWFHLMIQYDGETLWVHANFKPIFMQHLALEPVDRINTDGSYCTQYYDRILDPVEQENTRLCPAFYRREACVGTSTCKVCNQITGEYVFRSTASHLLNDDCTYDYEKDNDVVLYLPMDVINGTITDIKNPDNQIAYNPTMMRMENSFTGTGICFSTSSTSSNNKYNFKSMMKVVDLSFWVKVRCIQNERIELSIYDRLIRFSCDKTEGGSRKVSVLFKHRLFTFDGSFGLWSHIKITWGRRLDVYFNGKLQEISRNKYDGPEAKHFDGISIVSHDLRYSICLDDIIIRKKIKLGKYFEKAARGRNDTITRSHTPIQYDATLVENYYPNLNATDDIFRRQLLALDSEQWIKEIMKRDIPQLLYAEFLDQFIHDEKSESLKGVFSLYLSDINGAVLHQLENVTDTDGTSLMKLERFSQAEMEVSCPFSHPNKWKLGKACCADLLMPPEVDCATNRSLLCPDDGACVDYRFDVHDILYKLKMVSKWSRFTYLRSYQTYRTIRWEEVDMGYNLKPTSYIVVNNKDPFSNETAKIQDSYSTTFRVNLPKKYYEVCIVPMLDQMDLEDYSYPFCGITRAPAPVFVNCTYSNCDVKSNQQIKCFFTKVDSAELHRVYWGLDYNVPWQLRSGDVNTWNMSKYNTTEFDVEDTVVYAYLYTTAAYRVHSIAIQGIPSYNKHGVFGLETAHSCPAAPHSYPKNLVVKIKDDVTLTWTGFKDETQWNYIPSDGTYVINYGNVYLGENSTLFTQLGSNSNKKTSTSFSFDSIDDKNGCYYYYEIAAKSVELGPMSPKVCFIMTKNVPKTKIGMDYNGIVNITKANFSISSLSSRYFCGTDKYLLITAIRIKDEESPSTTPFTIPHSPSTFPDGGSRRKRRANKGNGKTTNNPNVRTPNLTIKPNETAISTAPPPTPPPSEFTRDINDDFKRFRKNLTYEFDFQPSLSYNQCHTDNIKRYLRQELELPSVLVGGFLYYTKYLMKAYICNENGCGGASNSIRILTGEHIPTCPPPDVEFILSTSTSLTLRWKETPKNCSHGIIINYDVSFTRSRFSSTVERNTSSQTMLFVDLAKYEKYCVKVAAGTYVGMGPYSTSVCRFTDEGYHESLPDITRVASSPTSITLTASHTDRYLLNGLLKYFILYYQPVDVHTPTNTSRPVPQPVVDEALAAVNRSGFHVKYYEEDHEDFFEHKEHPILLTGLTTYTFYVFSLAYMTNHSIGNRTELGVVRTGEDIPFQPPTNINGSGFSKFKLNVTWESIPFEGRNGIIRGYRIFYHIFHRNNNTLGRKQMVDVGDPDQYNATLTGLIPDSEYNVSVAGYTAVGVGAGSLNVTIPTGPYKDGNYTPWSDWTECSQWCDQGNQTRSRNCTNPAPWNGGANCTEKSDDLRNCTLRPCEVEGNYTQWTPWSFCSVSCGGGLRNRKRRCIYPVKTLARIICSYGLPDEEEKCKPDPCPGLILLPQGEMDCDKACKARGFICGLNIKTENKTDVFEKAIDGVKCSGNTAQSVYTKSFHPSYFPDTKTCAGYKGTPNPITCKPNSTATGEMAKTRRLCDCVDPNMYEFSEWASWSICSAYCTSFENPAIHRRKRVCYKEDGDCTGDSIMAKPCDVPECPVDGVWGEWSAESKCNESCNFGYRFRVRKCDDPPPKGGGMDCPGSNIHAIPACNAFPCPQNGGVSEWTQWTISEEPCGVSRSSRRRYCNNPPPRLRGATCSEALMEYKEIENQPCPAVDVKYKLRFDKEKWHYTMFYMDRTMASDLKEKIKENLYKANDVSNNTRIKSITFDKFERGSVIAFFNVEYELVNRDQIVSFNARIVGNQKLNDMSVSEVEIEIPSVGCPAPNNVSYVVIDEYSVKVDWLQQGVCNKTGVATYLYYARYNDLTNITINWMIAGNLSGNGTVGDGSMDVLGLEVAVDYGGYLVNSVIGIGNGAPSKIFKFRTIMTPPQKEPTNFIAMSNAPTKILLEWSALEKKYWGGQLLGYRVRYLRYNVDRQYQEKVINPGFLTMTLSGLNPYTLYLVDICGYNEAGNGPVEYYVLTTQQGVPSIPVPNLAVFGKQHINWWSVSWGEIPTEFVNGVLLGYRITYFITHRSSKLLGGEPDKRIIEVNNLTFYQKVWGCVSYARYEVTVAGFTIAGDGPSEPRTVETCNCGRDVYINWFDNPPYVKNNANKNLTGLLPGMTIDMVKAACGKCRVYDSPNFRIFQSKTGESNEKRGEWELLRSISSDVDISFPVYGQADRIDYFDNSKFLMIVKSSGSTLIARNETDPGKDLAEMIAGVLDVWPMLLVSYAIASVIGLLVWFVEKSGNPDEYPQANPLIGVAHGFWWSFVTMTTMGYGDQVPKTIIGRILSILWFLIGLVLNGIIIGAITSSIGITVQTTEYKLYNTKTAALFKSFEYQYAFRKSALIDPDVRYLNVSSMFDALQKKEVDLVLMETFSMANMQPELTKRKLKVAQMIDTNSGYGIVLGSLSAYLYDDISSLLLLRESIVTEFIAAIKPSLPTLKQDDAAEETGDIFAPDSYGFVNSSMWMGISIGVLMIFGLIFAYWRKKKMDAIVDPIADLDPLKEMVDEFVDNFEQTVEDLEKKHGDELFRLSTIKKSYAKMVSTHGVKYVERQLLISKAQSDRLAFINDRKADKSRHYNTVHLGQIKALDENRKGMPIEIDDTYYC